MLGASEHAPVYLENATVEQTLGIDGIRSGNPSSNPQRNLARRLRDKLRQEKLDALRQQQAEQQAAEHRRAASEIKVAMLRDKTAQRVAKLAVGIYAMLCCVCAVP